MNTMPSTSKILADSLASIRTDGMVPPSMTGYAAKLARDTGKSWRVELNTMTREHRDHHARLIRDLSRNTAFVTSSAAARCATAN